MDRTARVTGGSFLMGSREGGVRAPVREAVVRSFRMGVCEVTVSEYASYLNETDNPASPGHPQLRMVRGVYAPAEGAARKPVTHITLDEARSYCAWMGRREGVLCRLPTEEEWEFAARGGLARARYPWGWGSPHGRAVFDADSSQDVASFSTNPFGLYDMAGNLFEWCDPREAESPIARGGAWSERDPAQLTVFHRASFPAEYRGADLGFRIVIELPEEE